MIRRPRARSRPLCLGFVLATSAARSAAAQPDPPPAPDAPAPAPDAPAPAPAPAPDAPAPPAPAPAPPPDKLKLTPQGYIEAYYAYNFNRPSNGITNERAFDNRHNTFSLTNAAIGGNFESGPVGGRLMLQVGSLPTSSYASEPSHPGASGANPSNGELWKYLQEAYVTYKAPVGRGLLLQLGLCASPVGYETFAIKDNWNWSRSHLFFGFPFYHTGLRATYDLTDTISATVSVFNGWNSVVDNNEEKSVQSNVTYKLPDKLLLQILYFGGVERTTGAPEGPYWRHTFDAFGQWDADTWLSFAGQADYGWEPNRIGTASWWAGAAYVRVKPVDRVYVALRGDRFTEHLATARTPGGPSSTPIFYNGAEWVTEATATLDVRPHDNISVRLEYRHDIAEIPLYFRSDVQGDGSAASPYVANARSQDTALLGATAWF